MIEKVVVFILFLCPLVFFHELGHYLFARLFGVRIETFSIGFGPKILKWKRKGTEYALSLIPLGGYVKMFGDDPFSKEGIPEEERKYAFNYKSKWARFWIVLGGPMANFVLAYLLFFSLLMTGEKVPQIKLGIVAEKSEIYAQGLRTGDVIKKINNADVLDIADLASNDTKHDVNEVTIQRNGQEQVLKFNGYNLKKFFDQTMDLVPLLRSPVLVSPATGKSYAVATVSKQVNWKNSLDEMATNLQGGDLYLYELLSPGKSKNFDIAKETTLTVPQFADANEFFKFLASKGLYPADLAVGSIVMGSPADKANLKALDIMRSVNGKEVWSFEQMRSLIQNEGQDGKPLKISFLRGKKLEEISLTPQVTTHKNQKIFTIGVYNGGEYQIPEFVKAHKKSIGASFIQAFGKTWGVVTMTIDGFVKLITNEVSFKSLGGPLAIGKVASDSLNISISYFFKIMAIISVNLGILNLLPIPVLDGGHIMFIALEILNRGTLSQKKVQIAQQLGLSLLLLLTFAALFNDFTRFFH